MLWGHLEKLGTQACCPEVVACGMNRVCRAGRRGEHCSGLERRTELVRPGLQKMRFRTSGGIRSEKFLSRRTAGSHPSIPNLHG